ncbi:6197_t:CDS:2 [Entrophospora sp. SA101]|nr:6197_t:CDS:2 [Entrophospora sp. SA101]
MPEGGFWDKTSMAAFVCLAALEGLVLVRFCINISENTCKGYRFLNYLTIFLAVFITSKA